MERSILNTFSTAQIVIIFVGGTVLLTVLCAAIAQRAFPNLAESRFESVADSLRVVYELIFALILAFVIAAVLDSMSEAEAAVATEATNIAQLKRASESFRPTDEIRVDHALEEYVHEVVRDEWKTMRQGEESPRAAATLSGVYAAYRDVEPRGKVQESAYDLAVAKLDDVASERRERLNIAASDLPTMLRVLVVIGIVLLLVLEYRPALSRAASLVFMGSLAAIVTSAYLLTLVLNYPFAGDVSVSPAPLQRDQLATFWDRELRYTKKRGDEEVPLTADVLRGVWNSNAFGALVMRCYEKGDGPDRSDRKPPATCPGDADWYGVYRHNEGAVTGRLSRGIFLGWWREQPPRIDDHLSGRDVGAGVATPTVPNEGAFAWRAVERSGEVIIVGCWIYGSDATTDPEERHRTHPGWDLESLGRNFAEPVDLRDRFGSFGFRSAPPVPRTPRRVHDCARRAL